MKPLGLAGSLSTLFKLYEIPPLRSDQRALGDAKILLVLETFPNGGPLRWVHDVISLSDGIPECFRSLVHFLALVGLLVRIHVITAQPQYAYDD